MKITNVKQDKNKISGPKTLSEVYFFNYGLTEDEFFVIQDIIAVLFDSAIECTVSTAIQGCYT